MLCQPTPDGYRGDEAAGQAPARYGFGTLEFHPVNLDEPRGYAGSPLFDPATLTFPNGKTFTLTTRKNGLQRPYLRSMEVNGPPQ